VTCVDDQGLWMKLDATDRGLNRGTKNEVWPQRSAFFVAYKDLGLICRNSCKSPRRDSRSN
jgi:methylphosphotriester-DNA--protein-cysteine methyltransferase